MINLHGRNITADRSSLEHISSSITCGAGYETTGSGKDCGRHCSISLFGVVSVVVVVVAALVCYNLRA